MSAHLGCVVREVLDRIGSRREYDYANHVRMNVSAFSLQEYVDAHSPSHCFASCRLDLGSPRLDLVFVRIRRNILFSMVQILFFCETQYIRRRSHVRMYTRPYERTHAHPTPLSTSEELNRHILRLTRSPLASRHLPLKA
jgi:hypothetical protein